MKKWYNGNRVILGILLVIIPPIGFYGIIRRSTKNYKKVIAGLLFLLFLSIDLVVLIILMNSEMNNQKNYTSLKKTVDTSNTVNKKVINRNDSLLNDLRAFQIEWVDSVVESWSGSFIIDSKIVFPDTIHFELSESATKKFYSSVEQTLPVYQMDYENRLRKKLNVSIELPETKIVFQPNNLMKATYDTDEWVHPIILNKGLNIYEGNKYSKSYLGKLECQYIDKKRSYLDGSSFVIIRNDGNRYKVLKAELISYYWIKKTDVNYNSKRGLIECNN